MKKRALSAILALVLMAFAVIPGTVFADEDYTPDMSTPPKITRVEIIQNGSSYGIQVKIKTPTSVKNLMEMLEFFSMEHYISGICASVSLEGNAWQEMDLSYTDEGEKWSGFWASESISGLTASSWVQVRVCYTGTDKEGNPVISDWSGITALNGAADGPKEETEESFDFNAHDWAKAELTEADGAGLIPESLRAADLTQPITRAEFAAVSVRVYEALSGLTAEPAAVSPFTDTADAEVLKALNVGIMNPTTTDTGIPPAVNIQNKIYSVLEPSAERDGGVNLIGNLQAIRPESELFAILKGMGAQPIRHISDFAHFDDYQSMAKSRLNLVLAPSGKYASAQMEEKLGIPYLMALTAFCPENITETYQRIAEKLGAPCPSLEEMEQKARKSLCDTAKALNGIPVIVDGEAVTRPFEFARALLENGISVHAVYEQKLKPSDRKDFEWLREKHPEIPIRQTLHPKQSERDSEAVDCVAVGYSAGYLSGTKHVADIGGQNGLYGYHGVYTLMDLIREAAETETDMRRLLEDAVLVI